MKKIFLLLCVCCLFFGGCSREITAETITENYIDKNITCTARIEVLSSAGGEYTVCLKSTQDGDEAEVIAPASIAGIKAKIESESAEITYNGRSLYTALPSYRETAPVSCLSAIFESIKTSAPSSFFQSERRIDYVGGSLTQSLYFDEENSLTCAEVLVDGEMILKIEVTSLTID